MLTPQAYVETVQSELNISQHFEGCKRSLHTGHRKESHGMFQQTPLPGPSPSCGGLGVGRSQAAVVLQAR